MSQATQLDGDRMRKALGHIPTGVTVVTASHPEGLAGLAVGSFFSVSLDPPLVGFCVGHSSSSWPRISEVGRFCVNVLAADQAAICQVFASKAPDKFAEVSHSPSVHTGSPLIEGVLGWIDCEIETVYVAGDHDIVVARVLGMEVVEGGDPLIFLRGGYAELA